MPVPVRLEVCGLPTALSFTCNVPVLTPTAVGVNTTLMVHFVLAARLVEQVVAETLKSPVVPIVMPVRATFCLLVRVNTLATLVVPTIVIGKVLLTGVNVTGTMPVPESGTVCGLPGALSVMVKAPVRDPAWFGVKTIAILQFCPAANVLPHGLMDVVCAKSPLVAMLAIVRVAFPVLARITFFPPLLAPTTTFPNTNEVGNRVTTGPPLTVTVSCIVVVWVRDPDTPVIVTVDVPGDAVPLAVSVSVLVEVVGFGANPAVTPFGSPEALNVTLFEKPFVGTTVMVLGALLPCAMLSVLGFAVRLKSGPGTTLTTNEFDSMPLASATRL